MKWFAVVGLVISSVLLFSPRGATAEDGRKLLGAWGLENDSCLHGGYFFDGKGNFVSFELVGEQTSDNPLPTYGVDGWGRYVLDGDQLTLDFASDPYRQGKPNKVEAWLDFVERFLIVTYRNPKERTQATIFSSCGPVLHALGLRLLKAQQDKTAEK